MPKKFSDDEKGRIKTKLFEKGAEYFGKYGLKKTNIDDITSAVGISKGAFYLFFESKEEFFMQLLEQLENELYRRYGADAALFSRSPEKALKKLFISQINAFEENPIARIMLDKREFEYLMNKLPPERIMQHQRHDEKRSYALIKEWQQQGYIIKKDPKVIVGLMRAIAIFVLQKQIIGEDVYPKVAEMLIDFICAGLTEKGVSHD